MKSLSLLILCGIILSSCSLFNKEVDEIDAAESLWNDQDLTEYQFEYRQSCFCPVVENSLVVVRGDTVHSVLDPETLDSLMVQVSVEPDSIVYIEDLYPDLFGTIDGLFDVIREAKRRNADRLTEKYDSEYGYPTEIFIDYDFNTADDEFNYRISNFSDARPVLFKQP